MNKSNLSDVSQAFVLITSITEVVCGKRFMNRLYKRLKVLTPWAMVEVWVGVHNAIYIDSAVSTGNNAFAHSPIVKAETELILKRIEQNPVKVTDNSKERFIRVYDRNLYTFCTSYNNCIQDGDK